MSEQPLDPEAAALVAAQRREFVVRRRWMIATRVAALSFAAWYLILIIGLGYDSPFYMFVNIAAVITGVSAIVVVNYFDPPLLLRNLHRPDHPQRAANWRALQAIRGELLPPIVQDLGVPEGPRRDHLIHTADADELVHHTAAKMRFDRRRFGRIYLIAYLVLATAFIVLVATHTPKMAAS